MFVCDPHLPIFESLRSKGHICTGMEASKVYLKYDGQFLEQSTVFNSPPYRVHLLRVLRTIER